MKSAFFENVIIEKLVPPATKQAQQVDEYHYKVEVQ